MDDDISTWLQIKSKSEKKLYFDINNYFDINIHNIFAKHNPKLEIYCVITILYLTIYTRRLMITGLARMLNFYIHMT